MNWGYDPDLSWLAPYHFFIFVDSPDECVARVNQRVRKGGHVVFEADVRRRFPRAIGNLWRVYREIVENWVLLYNAETAIQDIAGGSLDKMTVREPTGYGNFLTFVEDSDDA